MALSLKDVTEVKDRESEGKRIATENANRQNEGRFRKYQCIAAFWKNTANASTLQSN